MRLRVPATLLGASLLMTACAFGQATRDPETPGPNPESTSATPSEPENEPADGALSTVGQFPPAELWAAPPEGSDGSIVFGDLLAEDIVKLTMAHIDLQVTEGKDLVNLDYQYAQLGMDRSGNVYVSSEDGNAGSVALPWGQVQLDYRAVDVSAGFGSLLVLDEEGLVHLVRLSGLTVISDEPVATTQRVTALASFTGEFDGESFALYEDGSVWWLDGHSFLPESLQQGEGANDRHLEVPQPFGVSNVERLIASANGSTIAAVLSTGETVIWGIPPTWGGTYGPSTLTGIAPLTFATMSFGVTDEGEMVRWDPLMMDGSGLSIPAEVVPGPSGAVMASGLFADSLGQAWLIRETFDTVAEVVSSGAADASWGLGDPSTIEWMAMANGGALVGRAG